MSKSFLLQKCQVEKKILFQNDVRPKKFLVQRNFEFKEFWLKTELSFRKIAQRFLIKTNLGKILGPERFHDS